MRSFRLLFENGVDADIGSCVEGAQRYLPGHFDVIDARETELPRDLLMPTPCRSYAQAYTSVKLFPYILQKVGEDTIVLLAKPLLADEWEGGCGYYLALGTVDKSRKHPIISTHGLGKPQLSTARASKVLAHEMAHATTGLVDGCCNEISCIMYNDRKGYTEISPEVLEVLDGKSGWCDFHRGILLGGGTEAEASSPRTPRPP